MDPVTLYALFTIADGNQRLMELPRFRAVEDCESFVAEKKHQNSMTGLTRHVCLPFGRSVPTWVRDHFKPKERPIIGVPLSPEYWP